MSFEKHEAIVNLLFSELQREPLEGFRRPTMGQLAAADREIHVKLSEKTRSGLPIGPLDQCVQQVLEMPAVMWLLMPKPRQLSAAKPNAAPDDKKFPRGTTSSTRPRASVPKHRCRCSCGEEPRLTMRTVLSLTDSTLDPATTKPAKEGDMCAVKPGCFSASHNFLNHDKAG